MDEIKFPVYSLPKQLQSIISETNSELNYPVNFASASLLFAASVAIGNNWTLKCLLGEFKPCLFMALIGERGSNKTHPVNYALAPLRDADSRNYKNYIEEWSLFEESPSDYPKPHLKQLIVRDITIESLCEVLSHNHKGVAIHCDELAGFFRSFNRYRSGGADQENYLSLWNGNEITVNRKSQFINKVDHPFASIIGTIQPEVLPSVLGGERIENGLFDRFLFVRNDMDRLPLLWGEGDMPSTSLDDWSQIIDNLLADTGFFEDTPKYRTLTLEESAWNYLQSWQNGIERDLANEGDSIKVAVFRKNQVYALRLCLIMHALREATGEIQRTDTIDFNSAFFATQISDFFFNASIYAYERISHVGYDIPLNCQKLKQLLPAEFGTAEAIKAGISINLSERTIYYYLNNFFNKIGYGRYNKE